MTDGYDYSASRSGIMDQWEHHAPKVLMSSIGLSILLGVLGGPPTVASVTLSTVAFGVLVVSALLMIRHGRRLCESCAAAIPLNATEQAQRYRRRLWTAHAGGQLKLVGLYLAVMISSSLLLTQPGGRWPWALIQTSMIYVIAAHATHRRLQPWCPWCSGGGGGGEFRVEAPDSPRGPGRQLV